MALERLEADGILQREGERLRTTRRWQAAMMRAASRLVDQGEESEDLRVPIASALVEWYGDDVPDSDLVELVNAMAPIEAAELSPRPPPRSHTP